MSMRILKVVWELSDYVTVQETYNSGEYEKPLSWTQEGFFHIGLMFRELWAVRRGVGIAAPW